MKIVFNKAILIFSALMLAFSINHAFAQTATFAIIGDYGTDNSNETAVASQVISWNPDFVVTVGDNIYYPSNYSEAVGKYYHQFMFPHDPLYGVGSDPSENHFWPALGNHEYEDVPIQDYLDYFTLPNNERYYTKKIGDIEFFMINSDSHELDGITNYSTQGLWIKDKIQSSTAKWKIVLFHHPTFSSTGGNSVMRWPFEDWGVDAVISGHQHNYERILKDENNDGKYLVYFVNGLGGAGIKSFGSSFISGSQKHYDGTHGAMKVIETSSSLKFYFINKNGTTIDSYINDSPFPVELAFFAGKLNGNNIDLRWRTETEINNYGFDVERKVGSGQSSVGNYEKIGFVNGNGNSNSPKEYSFVDKSPMGGSKFQYRLKQIDNDGQFKYTDVVEVEVVPTQFELSQNYPNPFNPSTKIAYTLPIDSKVSIKVYDMLGNEVATLENDEKEAGYYEVNFDAKGLASGVYFYNISAGAYNSTKKMVLMK